MYVYGILSNLFKVLILSLNVLHQEDREKKRQAEEEQKRQEILKAEQLRLVDLERQRQKVLELDRARERAIQQATLQREAEIREVERRRKEEWARKRQAELEEEFRKERESLTAVRQYHHELQGHLTKLELEKRTSMITLNQQKEKSAELSKIIGSLKDTYKIENIQLLQKAAEAKVSN